VNGGEFQLKKEKAALRTKLPVLYKPTEIAVHFHAHQQHSGNSTKPPPRSLYPTPPCISLDCGSPGKTRAQPGGDVVA
jgi:hypothetical protein